MILIVLAALCVLSVPLSGGRLGAMAELRLRSLWLAPTSLAGQVLIVNIVPGGSAAAHALVHVGTYALLGLFLWLNRRIAGAPVIALGALLNTLAIVANGGVMPAAVAAQRLAGLVEGAGFHNSAAVAHPHLLWLGDIIPVPGPLPNVLSVGDCIIFGGMLVLLHRTCGSRARTVPRARIQSDAWPAAAPETLRPQPELPDEPSRFPVTPPFTTRVTTPSPPSPPD